MKIMGISYTTTFKHGIISQVKSLGFLHLPKPLSPERSKTDNQLAIAEESKLKKVKTHSIT